MLADDTLRDAAEQAGVQQEFWDSFGRQHFTSPETNRAILTALGSEGPTDRFLRVLPPVLVTAPDKPLRFVVSTPRDLVRLPLQILAEDDSTEEVTIDLSTIPPVETADVNGIWYDRREVEIPHHLPLGYHEVRSGDASLRVIVGPDRAFLPRAEEGRCAGLGVMLYALRSDRNWGCGDFRDLTDLIDWAVPALGAGFIALNPLHAIPNRWPYNISPYLPATVFYRNFLYLDVESVAGYEGIRKSFETDDFRSEIERLRASDVVQYEPVAAWKLRALRLIFDSAPITHDARTWIAEEGDLLRLYALWCALDEHLHAANPDLWVWPDWPAEYRDPKSDAVHRFAEEHPREILFYSWLQWLVDTQIAEVQLHARGAGMPVGLYHDLALATDRCGADLWAHRPFFTEGCRVGSPPDDFSPNGQDWSFPPPNSQRHRDDGYRLFVQSIRKSLRHGGALRIDHVMRLFRLYWIPEGQDAANGAYVREPAADLVRILALESVRNRALIVGEDLGTVEPHVREALFAAGILSYRLLYFERAGSDFRLPQDYPEQSLASSTTHDLPTLAGFWTGADIDARLKTGMIDGASAESQRAARIRDKQSLLDALVRALVLPGDSERDASAIPELTTDLCNAILAYLASAKSLMWLVNQEDLTGEPAQQNLPGTTTQYPNWSRKMRWSLGDLRENSDVRDCAAMVRNLAETNGRGLPLDARKV